MLPLVQRCRRILILAALAAFVAPGLAGAGDLYRWETEDGGIAYTDDPRRIPERYRAEAVHSSSRSLDDYKRFTPTEARARSRYADRVDAQLNHLRNLNAQSDVLSAPVQDRRRDATVAVRSGRRGDDSVHTNVSADPNGGPVIVEEKRIRERGSHVTRHVTIVRQGDEILSVIKGRSNNSDMAERLDLD